MVAGTIQLRGKRFVIISETDYEKLVARRTGDSTLPPLPKPLKNGNYDAIAYARASLARKIIRDRRAAALSQAELARRAGIRPETLNRIEKLKLMPSVVVVDKIDRALQKAGTS